MDWSGRAGHMSGAGWLAMALVLLLLIALLVATAYTFVRLSRPGDPRASTGAPARRILDERFARGEIDPDDYHARRKLLDRDTR